MHNGPGAGAQSWRERVVHDGGGYVDPVGAIKVLISI